MNAARAGASRGVEPLGSQRRGAWGRKRGRKTGGLLRRRLRGCGLHRRDENDHTNMPKVVVTDLEPEEPPAPVKKKVKLAASTAEPPSSQNAPKKKKMKKENEAAGDERLPESRKAGAVHEKKRKAGQKPAGTAQEDDASQPKQKQQKRKGSDVLDEEAADIAQLDAQSQARFLWEAYTNLFGGSFLEQEAFEAKNILALPDGPSLEARLQAAVPGWKRKFAEAPDGDPHGAPRLLIVSSSALRALELMRQLPQFNKGCRVAKLFSKHMKQEEQAAELQSRVVCVGSGTPNRLARLAETDALSLDRLELVVLDLHKDVKKRSILDIPETRADWWELFKGHLSERVASGKTRLCLSS